jgi:hypothetical protein
MTEADVMDNEALKDLALDLTAKIGAAAKEGKLGITWPLVYRALTAYGDKRAREARDSLREQGYCMACGVYHRVGNCEAVENARREARAHSRHDDFC